MKISVSMITLNEEKNIARALSSCGFADEIVVVDGGSADGTLDILKANDKVVVVRHPWDNDFSKQRQVSLEHCTGDWVIRLDSDEAFSMEFEEGIRALLSSTPADTGSYRIHQCNLVGNEDFYSKIFDDYEAIPRIWRNLPGIRWERPIHEILAGIRGNVKLWDAYVVHYGFLDKKRYWQKGMYYSQIPGSGFKEPAKLYYREYDIQPRPHRAAVAPHVPEFETDEDIDRTEEIAIVRGPDLKQWELRVCEHMADRFNFTFYATGGPEADTVHTPLPVIQLPPRTGSPDIMNGLEFELFDKDLFCTSDLSWAFTCQAVTAKNKFGKKVIVFTGENIPFAYEEDEKVREMKQFSMRFADVFVALSEHAKEVLLLEGAPEEKVTVIPPGVDISRFMPDEEAGMRVRKNLGIRDEERVVLFAGRLVWEKGIYDLAHAAKLVKLKAGAKAVLVRYVIAGEGPELQGVRHRISELGMDEIFIFIGNYPYHKIHELYNAADIVVFPGIPTRTWKEQVGMALIEAMACGVPVIAAASGSIDEVMGDAGIIVQPGCPASLAAPIISLLKDEALRKELGEKGRKRAVEEYDSKKTARGLAALFEKVSQTTFRGAVRELAEYLRTPAGEILKRIRSVYSQQVQEWKGLVGEEVTHDRVSRFYSDTDSYLFDLVQYNYENLFYLRWIENIVNFCRKLKQKRGRLKVLDFGGGIGSLLIALSALKGVKLSYADIPGRTYEYAGWRFDRGHLDIDMTDATKEDFLGDEMFDVVIALDVVEHLIDPEASVGYLIRHIKPYGYLVTVTSFVDNYGEAGWHLNTDKYTDEAFYNLIKSSGMELLNKDSLPKYFRKASGVPVGPVPCLNSESIRR